VSRQTGGPALRAETLQLLVRDRSLPCWGPGSRPGSSCLQRKMAEFGCRKHPCATLWQLTRLLSAAETGYVCFKEEKTTTFTLTASLVLKAFMKAEQSLHKSSPKSSLPTLPPNSCSRDSGRNSRLQDSFCICRCLRWLWIMGGGDWGGNGRGGGTCAQWSGVALPDELWPSPRTLVERCWPFDWYRLLGGVAAMHSIIALLPLSCCHCILHELAVARTLCPVCI